MIDTNGNELANARVVYATSKKAAAAMLGVSISKVYLF